MTFSQVLANALALNETALLGVAIMAYPVSTLLPRVDKEICGRAAFGGDVTDGEHRALRDIAELFLFIEELPDVR